MGNRNTDDILQNIKTSTDALELFDVVSTNVHEMSGYHVVQWLRCLYNLQKNGHTTIQTSHILRHPDFEKLCRKLKSTSRTIELNELIESLKFLSYLGVNTNSEITVILLNLIRQKINEIELNQIVFLNFLLGKFGSTPLIEALKIALPILFEINLSVKLDHENIPQLTEFLGYIAKNQINDKCTMNVISALTLHGNQLDPNIASSIIWSLASIRNFQPQYERLLKNAFACVVGNIDDLTFEIIETTLMRVIDKYSINQTPSFYNEEFFERCAEIIIKRNMDFISAIFILKKFNKIAYINLPLLDYVAAMVVANPEKISDAKPLVLFTFVTAFSTANYTAENWSTIIEHIVKNRLLRSEKNELPWLKFSVELISLGCFDEKMLEKIFDKHFLYRHLSREYNFLDHLLLLLLYQSVVLLCPGYQGPLPGPELIEKAIELSLEKTSFPLQDKLEYAYNGKDFVRTKITTRYGHLIDHVVVFRDGQTIRINDSEFFEEICSDGSTP